MIFLTAALYYCKQIETKIADHSEVTDLHFRFRKQNDKENWGSWLYENEKNFYDSKTNTILHEKHSTCFLTSHRSEHENYPLNPLPS